MPSGATEMERVGPDGTDLAPRRPDRVAPLIGVPVAAPSPETTRLYAADWREFVAWCRATKASALPATQKTVAAYLLARAPGLSRGALGRRRAAIGAMHRQHGLPIPVLDSVMRAALRRAARPTSAHKAAHAASAIRLEQIAARCPRDLAGLRDRALLLLAAALVPVPRQQHDTLEETGTAGTAAFAVTRAAVLHLDVEHIRFTEPGVTLHLKARMDESTPRCTIRLPRSSPGLPGCPVRALEDWLRMSDTVFGPVFRKIDRWGNVEHTRLGPDAWRRILARRAGSGPTAPTCRVGADVRARSVASRAAQAAEALDRYLGSRPSAAAGETPQAAPEHAVAAGQDGAARATADVPPTVGLPACETRRAIVRSCTAMRLPHPDWLHHRLTITGPEEPLRSLRQAVAGAGLIPWDLDAEHWEEDWFLRLATAVPPTISLEGARLLAAQLRAAVERRHALAVARVGHSRACPFDLHALRPVPEPILRLGPDHPDALTWLWQHWGTMEPLRHVAEEPGRKTDARGDGVWTLTFWSADWTPWRALAAIGAAWPALRVQVRPTYDAA